MGLIPKVGIALLHVAATKFLRQAKIEAPSKVDDIERSERLHGAAPRSATVFASPLSARHMLKKPGPGYWPGPGGV